MGTGKPRSPSSRTAAVSGSAFSRGSSSQTSSRSGSSPSAGACPGRRRRSHGGAVGRGALRVRVSAERRAVDLVNCHLKSKLLTFPGRRFGPRYEGERARFGAYALYRRTADTCRDDTGSSAQGGSGPELRLTTAPTRRGGRCSSSCCRAAQIVGSRVEGDEAPVGRDGRACLPRLGASFSVSPVLETGAFELAVAEWVAPLDVAVRRPPRR